MLPNLHFLNFLDRTPRVCNEQCDLKTTAANWRSEEQKHREVREQNVCCWEVLNLSQCHILLVFCCAISQSHAWPHKVK